MTAVCTVIRLSFCRYCCGVHYKGALRQHVNDSLNNEKKNLNWIMRGGTCIPCDRFSMDTEWTQKAKKSLQEGYSVIIFPEGKIRTDGELNEFKSGFAFLARYTGAPVIPIGISGIYKFGRKTRYVVGQAEKVTRTPGVPSSQDLAEKSEHFRQVVIGLKKEALEVKKK